VNDAEFFGKWTALVASAAPGREVEFRSDVLSLGDTHYRLGREDGYDDGHTEGFETGYDAAIQNGEG
jgi:hypothetical protein